MVDQVDQSEIQIRALQALDLARKNGYERGLICLADGVCKITIAAIDSKSFGGKVLFVSHSKDVLFKARDKFFSRSKDSKIFLLSYIDLKLSLEFDIVLANISILRDEKALSFFQKDHFDYIIFDEFYNVSTHSYNHILNFFYPKFVLGLASTPERTDKRDILSLMDSNLVFSVSTSKLIQDSYLVPFRYHGLFDDTDYSSIRHNGFRYDIDDLENSLLKQPRNKFVLENYEKNAFGRKAIGVCVSNAHAEYMAKFFQENKIDSVAIHSGLSSNERDQRVSLFRAEKADCIFVRDLFIECIDPSEISLLLLLGPAESKVVFLQQIERFLRPAPNKKDVLIIDLIGNYFFASEIPEIIQNLGGEVSKAISQSKTSINFSNGCEIHFSKNIPQHCYAPILDFSNENITIEKIRSFYRKLSRSLNPIDVYLALGEDFLKFIRYIGEYKKVDGRLSSFSADSCVLNSDFFNMKTINLFEDCDVVGVLSLRSEEIFEKLADLIVDLRNATSDFSSKKMVVKVYESLTDIIYLITPLLFHIAIIQKFADEEAPQHFKRTGELISADYFFNYLAEQSRRTGVFFLINSIKTELQFLLELVRASEQADISKIWLLGRILERNSLVCLSIDSSLLLNITNYFIID
jgi:superfamily II DNA or RNA helicase